jgi:hypothetical protein
MLQAVTTFCETKLEASVQERMDKLLTDALDDMFRSYGDLGKILKEKVKDELKVDLEQVDFTVYREHLIRTTQQRVEALWDAQVQQAVDSSLGELLKEPPKELKLSELVELMKADRMEYEDEWPEACSFELKRDRPDTTCNFAMVYLDPEEGKSDYDCDFRVHLKQDKDQAGWEPIALHLPDHKLKKGRFIGNLRGFERALFQLHAAGTVLLLDENQVDTDYPENECHC